MSTTVKAPRRVGIAMLADLLQLWTTMTIVAIALWPIYHADAYIVLAVVAIALGTLIAAAGALFRWPGWVVLLVTTAAFAAVGVPLAVPGKAIGGVLPSAAGLADLFGGVALGWKQLLTITLPVGDYQALLVPALVLLLGGTVLAGSLALRIRFGELAAIVPAVLFVVALAFGPSDVAFPALLGFAMLVQCVVWASWRRWLRRRETTRRFARDGSSATTRLGVEVRTFAAALTILAIVGAGSFAALAAVPPSGDRDVLRNVVAQPFDPRDYTSPLAGFRRYLLADRSDAIMLRVTGLPADARIRIASLDSYDGIVYAVGSDGVASASGTFVRLPSALPRDDIEGERVSLEVAVVGYEGVWVPTVGALSSLTFTGDDAASLEDGFAVNLATGTAADLRGLSEGDSYRLTAVIPAQPTSQLLAETVPGSAASPRIADAPEELISALEQYTAGVDGAGAQLMAALDGLRDAGYISHGIGEDEAVSRAGHSLDRITELFDAPLMVGDAEQYAVAAALMADRLGFPARVVVGFDPDGPGEGAETVVRGSDITAWIEVNTADYGWVSLDPVPPLRPIPDEEPQDPTVVSRPESIVPPPADRPEPRDPQSDADTTAEDPIIPDLTGEVILQVLRVLGVSVLVIALVLAPFLLVIGAKARRRHLRRTAPSALGRIRGGWDEFADLVVDHGLAVPHAPTRSELAAVVGTLPSRVLAAVVDRAVFAPGDPADADADRVWTAVGELRTALDVGRTRRQKLRARISVRSLGGEVRRLLRRPGGRS